MLPIRLLKFWYPDALKFFLRVWFNLVAVLEEDLSVSLMWRLLFTPLFHDASITGRGLSFVFRLGRIVLGIGAILFSTVGIFILALLFFFSPILTILYPFQIPARILVVLGLGTFVYANFLRPPLKLWEVKSVKDVWRTSKISKGSLKLKNLLSQSDVKGLLMDLELNPQTLSLPEIKVDDTLLQNTLSLARGSSAHYISADYFFVSYLSQVPNIEAELMKSNLSLSDVRGAFDFEEFKRKQKRQVFIWDDDFSVRHLKGTNRGWVGVPTPVLDSVSDDLTKMVSSKNVSDFIGRESVVHQVIDILSTQMGRNVLIVGEAGAGKTTLINYLAKLIIRGDAPSSLATKRLVALDINKLIAGISSEGDLAARLKTVFDEVKYAGGIIVFIDEIQNLGIGDVSSHLNLYSLLQSYIESDDFQFLATTEEANFAKTIEKDPPFARLFAKVNLPPASEMETIKIIQNSALELEKKKINLSFKAIKFLVTASVRYVHDRVLPDSALSVLNESLPEVQNGWINTDTIKKVLGRRVNVPIAEADPSQKEELLNLEQLIHTRMIDQEEAVRKVADTLRRSAAGLRDQNRPIGSFLFVGPSGVGKTELAKSLAEIYFKNNQSYLRFDMSEYQTPQSIDRLLGTGDVPGELTETVKNKPYCLILLDEFEKADARVLTLFLQVLEDGRLTDALGQTTDFSNTIIIATSNVGSVTVANGLSSGQSLEVVEKAVKEELISQMKPELINRFDEVVLFKPLSAEDLGKIVVIKLTALQQTLKEQGFLVEFTPDLVSELSKRGYDPVLGARPMRRLIQDSLEAKLSRMMLEGKITKGQPFRADSSFVVVS